MNILEEIKQFFLSSNKLVLLYGLFMAIQVLGFIPNIPQPIVYAVMMLFAIMVITYREEQYRLMWLLLLYIPLEIATAHPDPYFQSYPRFVLFALLTICVSPIMQSEVLREWRSQLFKFTMWVATIIGVGSFFCYYLGINYMQDPYERDILLVGLFGGLTTHSMLLGPLSGIGSLYMIYKAYQTNKKRFWIFATLCLITCLFASSRTAVVASIAASGIMIYKLSGTANNFARTAVIIGILLSLAYPAWEDATSGIIEKQVKNEEIGRYGSRTELWEDRISEFQSSPIYGIGFVSVDPENIEMIEGGRGVIEPGSSWLSILSMLGIIGVIVCLPIFFKCFMCAWKEMDEKSCLCVGVLSEMFIYMVSEGFIFSAGSYLCFILWLTLGCAYDRKYNDFYGFFE